MTLQLDWLRGCATALVTPFTASGAIDEQRLRDLLEYQIAGGVRVLVPCGTTGESVTMTDEENTLVIRTTVELARGRAKVIAGTGSNSTAVTIKRSQNARELGVDGVLTVAPYYNKRQQEGLYAHFRAIAEAVSGLPVVIYNVSGRTSSNISAETTLRLARDVENIVATKEASGNLSQIMEINWNIYWTNLFMGGLLILYTVSGGAKAVAHTQKFQMIVVFVGMILAGYTVVNMLPEDLGFSGAIDLGERL